MAALGEQKHAPPLCRVKKLFGDAMKSAGVFTVLYPPVKSMSCLPGTQTPIDQH